MTENEIGFGGVDPNLVKPITDQQPLSQDSDTEYSPAVTEISGAAEEPGNVDLDLLKRAMTPAAQMVTPKPAAPPTRADLSKLDYAHKVAFAESGNKPNVTNPASSAVGLGQFLNDPLFVSLVKKYQPDVAKGKTDSEIMNLRTDPNVSMRAINDYGNENSAVLQKNGIPVSDATKYGAHFLGATGFSTLYQSDPNKHVNEIPSLKKAADSNPGIFRNADGPIVNGKHTWGTYKTVLEASDAIAQKMGDDYMTLQPTFGQAVQSTMSSLPGDMQDVAKQTVKSVLHPIKTLQTLNDVAVGLKSKALGWAGEEQDPEQKAQDEALVNALGNEYKTHYTSLGGFENYLMRHPAQVALDASAVTPLAEVSLGRAGAAIGKIGEMASGVGDIAARAGISPAASVLSGAGAAATRAGDIVGGAGKVVGTAGKIINPLDPGGLVSGAISGTGPFGARATTLSGALSSDVDAGLRRVTSNTFNAGDISRGSKAPFLGTIQEKGVNDAAIRDATIRSAPVPTGESPLQVSRTMATGEAPPSGMAREAHADAQALNNEKLARAATEISGASEASPYDLAANLEAAQTSAHNKAVGLYGELKKSPGSFGPSMLPDALNSDISSELNKSGIPSDLKLLHRSSGNYPQTHAAVQLLQDSLVNGQTRLGGEIDAPELMEIRRQLTDLRSKAEGSDVRGVGDVINAFHNHVQNAADAGSFVDTAGNPVTNFSPKLRAANAAYKDYFDTFENSQGANAPIAKAVKTLKAEQGRGADGSLIPTNDSSLHRRVQQNLTDELYHQSKGPSAYDAIENAMGGKGSPGAESLRRHVKQTILGNDGLSMRPIKTNDTILNDSGSVAAKAFADDPESLARAKHIHAAHKLNNAKPTKAAQAHSILSDVFGKGVRRAGAAVLGYHSHGIPGMIAAEIGEGMLEHHLARRSAKKAMSGAPKGKQGIRGAAGKIVSTATNPVRAIPAQVVAMANEQNAPAQSTGGRITRAAGGQVGMTHEQLVNHLMTRAKQAKRATDNTTKPLLNAPDEAIVKALDVAQQAI